MNIYALLLRLFIYLILSLTAMSLCLKSLFATFSKENQTSGVEAFIRKIELGGSALSDALSNLGAYQLYLDSIRDKSSLKPCFTVMRENFVKSSSVRNLEYLIDRVHRRLYSGFGLGTERKLKTVSELLEDNHTRFQVQLLLASASYPNIFYRAPATNQERRIKLVQNEIGYFNPSTSFLLETEPTNDPPTHSNLKELTRQLTFASDQPIVSWQGGGKLAVQYDPDPNEPDEWVGNVAKNVYRGLKFKAMCHKFFWTHHNMYNLFIQNIEVKCLFSVCSGFVFFFLQGWLKRQSFFEWATFIDCHQFQVLLFWMQPLY